MHKPQIDCHFRKSVVKYHNPFEKPSQIQQYHAAVSAEFQTIINSKFKVPNGNLVSLKFQTVIVCL